MDEGVADGEDGDQVGHSGVWVVGWSSTETVTVMVLSLCGAEVIWLLFS